MVFTTVNMIKTDTYVTKLIMEHKNNENKEKYTKALLIVNLSFQILEVFGKIYRENIF